MLCAWTWQRMEKRNKSIRDFVTVQHYGCDRSREQTIDERGKGARQKFLQLFENKEKCHGGRVLRVDVRGRLIRVFQNSICRTLSDGILANLALWRLVRSPIWKSVIQNSFESSVMRHTSAEAIGVTIITTMRLFNFILFVSLVSSTRILKELVKQIRIDWWGNNREEKEIINSHFQFPGFIGTIQTRFFRKK